MPSPLMGCFLRRILSISSAVRCKRRTMSLSMFPPLVQKVPSLSGGIRTFKAQTKFWGTAIFLREACLWAALMGLTDRRVMERTQSLPEMSPLTLRAVKAPALWERFTPAEDRTGHPRERVREKRLPRTRKSTQSTGPSPLPEQTRFPM